MSRFITPVAMCLGTLAVMRVITADEHAESERRRMERDTEIIIEGYNKCKTDEQKREYARTFMNSPFEKITK